MSAPEPAKKCSKCGETKPLDQFAYDGRTRDRLKYRCVNCQGKK